MEEISLSEIIEKCLDFRQDPREELYKDIEKTIALIDVKERLSLAEKGLAILSVLNQIQDNKNALECAFDLTVGFFFKGTLSYCTNLKVDIPVSLANIEIYDVLVTFGLEDRVLEFCGPDHARLRKMLDDAVNFSNVFRLVESAKLLSNDNIAELDRVLKGLKNELTIEKIRELKGILAETDPLWTDLKESVGEEAVLASTTKDIAELGASLRGNEGEPGAVDGGEEHGNEEPGSADGGE